MSLPSNWPRNRLLLALPPRNLRQLLPELEDVPCQREQVLLDVDSSLDEIFFPHEGVVSVMAVYSDGGTIEMATIGREGCTGLQAVFGANLKSTHILSGVIKRLEQEGGGASIWGRGETASATNAAFVNGTMVQGYGLDDAHPAAIHTCAAVLPAAFSASLML